MTNILRQWFTFQYELKPNKPLRVKNRIGVAGHNERNNWMNYPDKEGNAYLFICLSDKDL